MGTAVTELAICLPILVIITIGTIEACTMLHVRQKLKTAAYEGARVGVFPGAEAQNVSFQCQLLLDAQRVKSFDIQMNPSDPSTLGDGEFFTVTTTAPCAANSLIGGLLYSDRTLTQSASLSAN